MGARPEKTAVVAKVRDGLSESPATLLTDYRGLSVHDMAELREKLREHGARYSVAKNTLIRLAARELSYDVPDETLTGPTALAYAGEDIANATKALKAFAKDHPELIIKGAILEGSYIGADEAAKLADLETREELLADIAGMLQTLSGTELVGFFESMLQYIPSFAEDMLGETEGLLTALEAKKQ